MGDVQRWHLGRTLALHAAALPLPSLLQNSLLSGSPNAFQYIKDLPCSMWYKAMCPAQGFLLRPGKREQIKVGLM
jgi:hypothetical protein